MRLNRLALSTIALLSTVLAVAQTLPYAHSRTTISAGVLLIDSQRAGGGFGAPANIAPHVWSNLDKDIGVKPASWTFDNPLGQTMMTADARERWLILQGSLAGLPAVGARLGKADASYWEVRLTTATAETLSQFDVLSLTINGTLSLNSIEREKLRRYVDQGGVLWIDLVNDAAITLDLANGLPYGFDWAVTVQPVEANLNHPLMSSPNSIRLDDLDRMKYSFTLGDIVTLPINLSGNSVEPLVSWVSPDSLRLEPIVGNSDGRTVSSAQLGEGYLVVTPNGVTATINRGFDAFSPPPRTPQVNRGFRGLAPVQDQSYNSAAKFAINVISLATSYSTLGGGSRNSGGSAVTVDAPMLPRFQAEFGPGAFDVNKSASIFKGYIVTTAGGRVSVFDADPSRDIDHDGDPDDGVPDPLGSGADLVWQSVVIGGRLSTPTVVEVPATQLVNGLTGFRAINQIWVVDSKSNVHVFDLENPGGLGLSALTTIGPAGGDPPGAPDASGPYAPTVHEGVVVIADSRSVDNLGRVWLADLNSATAINTGNFDWSVSGFGRMTPAGGPATVGYIPIQDGSSGLDRVIYVPHQPPAFGTPRPASLTSLWLGARGEQQPRANEHGRQKNSISHLVTSPACIFLGPPRLTRRPNYRTRTSVRGRCPREDRHCDPHPPALAVIGCTTSRQ
ncbi:MAG: hypothetical protein IH884_00880 [Myxococcales bacterium]|nr:hypothetical protein [Myxococcales bacterium]